MTRQQFPRWFILLFIVTVISFAITLWMIATWIFEDVVFPTAQITPSTIPVVLQEKLISETPFSHLLLTTSAPLDEQPPIPVILPTDTLIPTTIPSLTSTPDLWAERQLANMTLTQKIGQMIMTGVNGDSITSHTCQVIQDLTPGGVVYRGVNVYTPDQLRHFSSELQECAQTAQISPLLIALDHEGQYVTRFSSGVTVFPAAMALGATGDPNYAYLAAKTSGSELAYSGVNVVLGPVADVLGDYDNSVISQRSYGEDPKLVSQFVAQAVIGYHQAGILPVLKHFPGHGGIADDSHYTLPVDQADLSSLELEYLPPFQSGLEVGSPLIMFSHVAFPNVDLSGNPATLSPSLVVLLRDQLGFQGVILTDSMGMGAITQRGLNIAEASLQAVNAGMDMLLITSPASAKDTRDRLLLAVRQGEISTARIDDAVRRILAVKAAWGMKSFPLSQVASPDWSSDARLASDIGYRAVTLYRDENRLIPIPSEVNNLLIIGPTDGWGLYSILGTALAESGYTYHVVTYSSPWNGRIPERSYLDTLPNQALSYDLILMFTWEAHLNRIRYGDDWQIELVNRLQATDPPMIVVALKSPTDILEFPQISTYVATYGTTGGQLHGLAEALVGRWQLVGQNPLPNLP
jgi:beta-N-acetylhexosaminidase